VFSPTSAGAKTASLVLGDGTTSATVELVGTGFLVDPLSLTGGPWDFGTVVVGDTTGARSFTLTNTGAVTLGTLSVQLAGAGSAAFRIASDTCTGATLAPGVSCTTSVTFQPTAVGMRSAMLELAANPGGTVSAALTGTGASATTLTIAPAMLDFGHVTPQPTPPRTFTITNTGSGPSTPIAVQVSGANASEFMTSGTCAGAVLAAGASCAIDVVFHPVLSPGLRGASVDVTAANAGPISGTVLGSCCASPGLRLSPITEDFETLAVGAVGPVHRFTLTNYGAATTSSITLSLGGANASDFHIDATSCGNTLQNLESCTIDVSMRPLTSGPKSATLHAAASLGGSPSAALRGDAVTGGYISGNPTYASFTAPLGTAGMTQTFTITNNAAAAAPVPTFTFSGAAAADYTVSSTTCTGPIAPGTSCRVTVGFTPGATGSRPGVLNVTSAGFNQLALGLAGTGT
jgi:hypothetical protein